MLLSLFEPVLFPTGAVIDIKIEYVVDCFRFF